MDVLALVAALRALCPIEDVAIGTFGSSDTAPETNPKLAPIVAACLPRRT